MSEETVRYSYRLRPGAVAERALVDEWHRSRWVWNDAINQMRHGQRINLTAMGKQLTAHRGQLDWLRAGSQDAQQQELRTFLLAYSHAFKVKGRRRPTFKSAKKTRPSVQFSQRGFSVKDARLVLPKGIRIPVVWSRDLPSEPTSVRIYRDTIGHWYASFVVRRPVEPVADADGGIGIDWGISTTATTTDPAYDLPYQGERKSSAVELTAAQRQMSRRYRDGGKSQSKGYQRAKQSAAKAAKKAHRRNTHTGRVWAHEVTANHQTIAVENFRPAFLLKSTMARKAADAAIGTLKQTLIEYAERAGRKVVLVEPAYTTSTCSECFARTKRLKLDDRTFSCLVCGYTDGRDRNAAKTILAVAERGHASVESVRHSMPPSEVSCAA